MRRMQVWDPHCALVLTKFRCESSACAQFAALSAAPDDTHFIAQAFMQ